MPRLAVRVPCDRTVGDVFAAAVEVAAGVPDDVFNLLTGSGRAVRWHRLLDVEGPIAAHARAVIAAAREAAEAEPTGRTVEATHEGVVAHTTATVDRHARSWQLAGVHRHGAIEAPYRVGAAHATGGWTVSGRDWHGVVQPVRHGVQVVSVATDGRAAGDGTVELRRTGTDHIDIAAHRLDISDRVGVRSLRVKIDFDAQEVRCRIRVRLRVRGTYRLAQLMWPLVGWWVNRRLARDLADWPADFTSQDQWPEIVTVADAILGTKRTTPVRPTPKPSAPRRLVQLPMQPGVPVRRLGGPSPGSPSQPSATRRQSALPTTSVSRRTLLRLAPIPLLVGTAAAVALPWLLDRGSRQLAPPAIAFATACEADDVVVPELDLAWDDPGCLRMQDEAFHRRHEGPDDRPLEMFGWRFETEAVQVGETQWLTWGAGPPSDLCFTADARDGSLDRGDVVDCFGPGLFQRYCPSDPSATPSLLATDCEGHEGLTAYNATRRTLLEDDRGQRTEPRSGAVPAATALAIGGLGSVSLVVRARRLRDGG